MNNLPSFTSSENFNQCFSIEDQSQDLSNKSRKDRSKKSRRQVSSPDHEIQEHELKSSKKNKKAHQQPKQSDHKHDSFDDINQEDSELASELQFGLIGSNGRKKIKNNATEVTSDVQYMKPVRMEEESKRNEPKQSLSLLDEMFQKMKLSNGEESVFYEYDPNQQQEARLIYDSLREMFSKKCKIAGDGLSEVDRMSRIAEKAGDYMSFQFADPKLEDYTVVGILGKGLHGLVIMMRSKYKFNAVIKLFEKRDREEFMKEAMILQSAQKAKELKILKTGFQEDERDNFNYICFERERYCGIFVKEGLGSFWDFREYLRECQREDDNFELSGQELLALTWPLLDACNCLHKIQHVHRDIKLGNIVLDADNFLPELIDFSLACEISEARGKVGTQGYRREDFYGLKDYSKEDQRDRLILNDYFALGKSILELAFPAFQFKTVKDIRGKLQKLAKAKEKQMIAKILEICIFGDTQRIQVFFQGCQSELLNGMGPDERKMYKDLQLNSDKFMSTKSPREKHFKKFETFMNQKLSLSQNNTKSELKMISSEIMSEDFEDQMASENISDYEMKLIYDKERQIKNSFEKDPQKAKMICDEVLEELAQKKYPKMDTQIYSTLLAVFYLTDSLDKAISFGEEIALLPAVEEDWIFKNNLLFLKTKEKERKIGDSSLDFYLTERDYFLERYKENFIEDLEEICSSAARYCHIGKGNYVKKPLKQDLFIDNNEKEIILTFFEMELTHSESYFFMNYCFMLTSLIDDSGNEEINDDIKQFVFDMNHQTRVRVLSLVKLSPKERVLFAVLSFCKIFEDVDHTNLDDSLKFLQNEAKEVTALKEQLQASVEEKEDDEDSFWDLLFDHLITPMMIGFIIRYNLEYDLIDSSDYATICGPESPPAAWFSPSRVVTTVFNRRFDAQKCLDSIMSWIIESPEKEEYFVPIDLMKDSPYEIYCLLFFGKRLKDLILDHRFVDLKGCMLGIIPKEDLSALFALKMNFRLTDDDDMESIDELFTESNINKLYNLQNLTLGLWGYYDERVSLKMLGKIVKQLSVLQLSSLDIRMVKQIAITDEGFALILNLIQSQVMLEDLALQFNLSLISHQSIVSLAKIIINLKELQHLQISFRHCSKIERKSMEDFILQIKKSSKLETVKLRFIACTKITDLVKPLNLPYELEIDLAIDNGYIPADLDENSDDDDEYCGVVKSWDSFDDKIGCMLGDFK